MLVEGLDEGGAPRIRGDVAPTTWHDSGMTRTRLSTTVDADLLAGARKASGKPDSAMVDDALAALIATNVAKIQNVCDSQGIQLPAPDKPNVLQKTDFWADSAILEASTVIVSAAAQLTAIVRPPTSTIVTTALQVR